MISTTTTTATSTSTTTTTTTTPTTTTTTTSTTATTTTSITATNSEGKKKCTFYNLGVKSLYYSLRYDSVIAIIIFLCIIEKFDHTCIERGYLWLGGTTTVGKDLQIETPELCQLLCNATDECNWFGWRDLSNPTGCWLLDKKGSDKRIDNGRDQGATGPKNCIGE